MITSARCAHGRAAFSDRTGQEATVVIREEHFLGFAHEECSSYYGDTHAVWKINEDGTVVRMNCTDSDTGGFGFDFELATAESAGYFEDCAGLDDETEKYTCLRAGLSTSQVLPDCEG